MPAHRSTFPHRNIPARILIAAVGVVFALLGGALAWGVNGHFTSVSDGAVENGNPSAEPSADTQPEATPTPTPEPEPEPEPVDITIAAAGDILTHMPVLRSAEKDGEYDLTRLWHRLDPWVQGADLSLCHMEVPVAPEGTQPSGYPMFGAPATVARDAAAQGWDGCSTASNHSVDRGFAGIEATLGALSEAGLGGVGTARTEEEADQPQIYLLERAERTVKIAHLSATYGLNGLPKPSGKPWAVEVFDAETPEVSRLLEQADAAREDGADLVIASVHCCVEYQTAPTAAQSALIQALADAGTIDLVIGHHAHVPQPITQLEGGPDGEGMWVAYGLGNYISNQSADCCVPQASNGLMMFATAHVPPTGPVRVTDIKWLGVTVDRLGQHQLFPLAAGAEATGKLSASQMETRYGQVREAVGPDSEEMEAPPEPSGPPVQMVPRDTSEADPEPES